MEEIKVILLCSSRFAFPVLQWLHFSKQLGAVMIPEHCREVADEVKDLLGGNPIPVIITGKKDFEKKAIAIIKEHDINAGLVATFSFMIPPSVFALPVNGFYNIHPGPLPAYRGADPIFHQVKNREKRAAVVIHKVEEAADSGAVVIEEQVALEVTDTYGMLAAKLAVLATKLTGTLLKILSMGFAVPAKQQEEARAFYYPPQQPSEFAIDWNSMEADAIIALIHACNPHNKGAATKLNNKIIRLVYAEKMDAEEPLHLPPGTIHALWPDRMELAVAGNFWLKVGFIWIEEGFFLPGILQEMGVKAGMQLENIF